MIDQTEPPPELVADFSAFSARAMVQDMMRTIIQRTVKTILAALAEQYGRRRHARRYQRMSVRRAQFTPPRRALRQRRQKPALARLAKRV